jgi:hypothetical protein
MMIACTMLFAVTVAPALAHADRPNVAAETATSAVSQSAPAGCNFFEVDAAAGKYGGHLGHTNDLWMEAELLEGFNNSGAYCGYTQQVACGTAEDHTWIDDLSIDVWGNPNGNYDGYTYNAYPVNILYGRTVCVYDPHYDRVPAGGYNEADGSFFDIAHDQYVGTVVAVGFVG